MEVLNIKRSIIFPLMTAIYPKRFGDKRIITFTKPELILIRYSYRKKNFVYLVDSSKGNDLLFNFSRPINILLRASGRQASKIKATLKLFKSINVDPYSVSHKFWIFLGAYTLKKSILEETLVKSLDVFSPEFNAIKRYKSYLEKEYIK